MRDTSGPRHEQVRVFGGKCQACGYDKCFRALQFHHVDKSEKKAFSGKHGRADVAEIVAHPERFKLLCANCHIEQHYEELQEKRRSAAKPCRTCGNLFVRSKGMRHSVVHEHCSKECFLEWRWVNASQPSQIRARMMKYVKIKEDGCWIWTGHYSNGPAMTCPNKNGGHTPRSVRRVSCELHHGCCYKKRLKASCGKHLCVNPDHLQTFRELRQSQLFTQP